MNFITTNLQALLMGAAVMLAFGVAVSGLYRYDGDDGERSTGYHIARGKWGAIALAVGLTLAATIAYVPAGHRGVVMDGGSGVQAEELDEGWSFVIPFWQRVHNVNVRTQVYVYESFVQTEDLQEITLPIAINYSVIPNRAAELFQEVGHDYEEIVIDPAAFQASTEATGQIVAESIAQSRAELVASIATILRPQLASHGIRVEFVAVKDAVFDPAFLTAVKAKVIATQKAEESARLVVVAENEARQTVATADGEAQALAIVAAARKQEIGLLNMTPTEYVWFKTWNGVLPLTWLGSDGEIIVQLP